MSRFLETICIRDGLPMHLDWHQRRVDATLSHFYPSSPKDDIAFQLAEIMASCELPSNGVYRCRLIYDVHTVSVEFFPYAPRSIKALQLIEAPTGFDYRYKYADRRVFEELYNHRSLADDILITRDGWITDTSAGNIAFQKNNKWYTPSFPLLAGTTWKRLIASGLLLPRPIHASQVKSFDAFKVFNAMNDWDDAQAIGVENIAG